MTIALRVDEPSHPVPEGAPHALVHVPEGFRSDQPWDLVVFLHGWNGCVNVLMGAGPTRCVGNMGAEHEGWELGRVFDQAERNALFLMPQLAFDRRDGTSGRFREDGFARRFLEAVADRVEPWPERPPRRTILTAHSAGFETALAWLQHGEVPIDEVVLFDALYSGTAIFAEWWKETEDRRLVSIHIGSGSTAWQSRRLRRIAAWANRSLGESLSSDASMVVMETDVPHRDVPRAHLVDALRGTEAAAASATENQ